jgi:hypothetical protein
MTDLAATIVSVLVPPGSAAFEVERFITSD